MSLTHRPPRLMVLWAPDWPVLAHARAQRLSPLEPIALIEKGMVFACSAAARAEGVRRGLRMREAQARCPHLRLLDYDAALDARAFEPVLTALEQTLPGTHPLRPGSVAVRARGPARYYGGERPAALSVIGAVAGFGVEQARVGIADGLFAAERAVRSARPIPGPGTQVDPVVIVEPGASAAFLAPLPVSLLVDSGSGGAELADLLPRLGIRTLGAFAELDAQDVIARFGPDGAQLHALAGGRDARSASPRIPPRDGAVQVDFDPPLELADQVAFGVRTAAEDFVDGLLRQRLVCTALRVELFGDQTRDREQARDRDQTSDTGHASDRVWLHPRSFSPAEVVDRVRWQLAGGLDSAVTRVRISPEAVDPVATHERGLWGAGPDERVHSGLSRVQSMVGHAGVLTPTPSGGRRPADRQTLVPWGDRPVAPKNRRQPWPGALPDPAPATVYELPRELVVQDVRGRPVSVDDRGALSGVPAVMISPTGARRDVTSWAGPWPLSERWWDADSARRVDRFQVVDAEGSAWLLVRDERGWWAEGRYD